jgi:hypothetical protein
VSSAELDEPRAQFHRFADVECRGRSPLYAEICRAVAREDDLLELYGRTPERQRRPNLLLAAIHFLLLDGAEHPLAAHVPTVAGARTATGTAGEHAVAFCREHADEIAVLLTTRNTQTNEVNRCAALLPALVAATPRGAPLRLVELGASGGLNLLLDRYAYRYDGASPVRVGDGDVVCTCTVDGTLPDLGELPVVAERTGVDLHPVDVRDDDAARWLLACVFADQPHRVARLRAAIAAARERPPQLVRADGPSTVAAFALDGDPGLHPVVWHSNALVYTFAEQQRELTASLDGAAAERDLTWIYLEAAPGRIGLPPLDVRAARDAAGCALVAVSYRDGERSVRQLAAADPHLATMTWLA